MQNRKSPWDGIPLDLHASFVRYMCRDAWTAQPDLLSLRESAMIIVRDAITHTGEFGDGEYHEMDSWWSKW